MRTEGRTVLLTTNYPEEADALCDPLAVIDHGRLVALGVPAELRARYGKQVVGFELDAVPPIGLADEVRRLPGVAELRIDGPNLEVALAAAGRRHDTAPAGRGGRRQSGDAAPRSKGEALAGAASRPNTGARGDVVIGDVRIGSASNRREVQRLRPQGRSRHPPNPVIPESRRLPVTVHPSVPPAGVCGKDGQGPVWGPPPAVPRFAQRPGLGLYEVHGFLARPIHRAGILVRNHTEPASVFVLALVFPAHRSVGADHQIKE